MNSHNDERLGLEKRKYVRLDIELKAQFKIVGDNTDHVYHAVTKNISHGGACLKIYDKKNELLRDISMNLPKLMVEIDLIERGGPLDVYARTAWISSKIDWISRPAREELPILMGMAFEDLAQDDEDKINSFIAELIIEKRTSILD